jgi:hypothetical protein
MTTNGWAAAQSETVHSTTRRRRWGNAGIIRELLRYARIHGGQDQRYAIAWPDHPAAAPCQPAAPASTTR